MPHDRLAPLPEDAVAGRRLPGLPIAAVRTARLEAWHAPDVFDASDDHAFRQHPEQGLPIAVMFAATLPLASPALITITPSS